MNPLVVISFYDRRPVDPLIHLLDSLDEHAGGLPFDRAICVNATNGNGLPDAISSRVDHVMYRENTGMNIGAWDAAWKHHRGHDAYLFLQDECFAVRDGWLLRAVDLLRQSATGMVGESFNPSWDKPWDQLRAGPGRDSLPEHLIDGEHSNRVDVYLHHIRRRGIEPGPTARHLRSLTWGVCEEVLDLIGGFPLGRNYGECIAAEIGVSRAIESHTRTLGLLGPVPFHFFRHAEWSQDHPGAPFTHKPVLLNEVVKLRAEVAGLRRRIEQYELCQERP